MRFFIQALSILLIFLTTPASAGSLVEKKSDVTVAIVDTGVYGRHPAIEELRHTNRKESEDGRDNDKNGYVDDRHGWNFIAMDPLVFDSSLYPTFGEDFFKYYEIRKKRSLDISTEEEDKWYSEKRKDDDFQDKRSDFSRFMHATHVGGIASGIGLKNIIGERKFSQLDFRPQIMGITYLGDAKSGPAVEPEYSPLQYGSDYQKVKALKEFVKNYLKWQKNKLRLAMEYGASFAQVVNCSFGISPKSARSMAEGWWEKQFPDKDSNDEQGYLEKEKEDLVVTLREGLLRVTGEVVNTLPETIFVFSAGNTKLDTEEETHYPSGVKCDHCLSVGATLGTEEIAYFTNRAKTRVTIYAPGVAMESIVPFNRTLPVNGTSQAAPQVAYTAALVFQTAKDNRLNLDAKTVRRILVESVDKKHWLEDLGESEGIVNPLRAAYLTTKLRKFSFSKAKTLAYKNIPDLSFYPGPKPQQQQQKNALRTPVEADELFSK